MFKDWQEMEKSLSGDLRSLRAGAPEVMKGFGALAQAALKADALDGRTKELLALAIAVATRCDGAIAFHAEAALKRGASRAEVLETMGMAIYMGAGPNVLAAAQALEAFDQFAMHDAAKAA
ncbi:MAG TPA: carboxymuconolactone decarboxylase family protein [Acetobacteraceae bacterium]|jgi:AhpD family alkylhydroperoxidase|nr:carboxymuconolactone decarboxylase family protein [Acetobacteraceae bacterium]